MHRSILCSLLAVGLVMPAGPASAQSAPPVAAPPVAAPPMAAPPPPAAPAPAAQSGFPPAYYTDLGVLSVTLASLFGTGTLFCLRVSQGAPRDACEGSIGGFAASLAVTSIPLFVLGSRTHTPTPVTLVASLRGVTLGSTF